MFGKLISYDVVCNVVEITFEERMGRIEVITSGIINVFSPFRYNDHFSRAVEKLEVIKNEFEVTKTDNCLEISTGELIIRVYDDFKVDFLNKEGISICEDYKKAREPFVRRGYGNAAIEEGHTIMESVGDRKIQVVKKIFGDEKFYGLGDRTGHLNKRGYEYEMWNIDDPKPHVESYKSLYKSIPFFITLRECFTFGIFFDNTFKSYFDMAKENDKYYYFASENGNLDYYFIYGENMKEVVSGYTYLTGKTPIPQLWTLGYQQSRWSYSPESRVREIARKMREEDIPCDVIHLDIDYMDEFKVFTWGKDKFPNPEKTLKELKENGFKVVTIIDPGVKKELGYKIFDEGIKNGYFATDKDGITYVNQVWPGDSVYPDFSNELVRNWWANNQKILLEDGVSGIWNDMNEPASFNGPLPDDVYFYNEGRGGDHTEIHNVYGHLMSKATYEGLKKHTNKRPFVITRACYAGTQKYSTVWTGDNQSFWEHLRMAVPMLLNLGLSGMSFAGVDVGGFSFDCSKELLSRWIQIGAFTPLFRNHSCMHTRDQEPWAYDEETLIINRKYIKLRYKLLPYFYDLFYMGEKTGLPIMRPLVLHYEKDVNTMDLNDEFLVGENILVAPILSQGKTVREVYLPEGEWVDYWTKEVIIGGKYLLKEAPLDVCPIYIKKGSIVPNYPEQRFIGEKDIKELTLDLYCGNGSYLHYVDDFESFDYQNGIYNLYEFVMEDKDNVEIYINVKHKGYDKNYESFKIVLNTDRCVNKVEFNDNNISFIRSENGIEFILPVDDGKILIS